MGFAEVGGVAEAEGGVVGGGVKEGAGEFWLRIG